MTCELCKRNSPVLDFSSTCCRVRFLMTLPSRDMRAEWLERWRKRDGHRMADEVEKEVKERWSQRRKMASGSPS